MYCTHLEQLGVHEASNPLQGLGSWGRRPLLGIEQAEKIVHSVMMAYGSFIDRLGVIISTSALSDGEETNLFFVFTRF
jgi:hypothetical protein